MRAGLRVLGRERAQTGRADAQRAPLYVRSHSFKRAQALYLQYKHLCLCICLVAEHHRAAQRVHERLAIRVQQERVLCTREPYYANKTEGICHIIAVEASAAARVGDLRARCGNWAHRM